MVIPLQRIRIKTGPVIVIVIQQTPKGKGKLSYKAWNFPFSTCPMLLFPISVLSMYVYTYIWSHININSTSTSMYVHMYLEGTGLRNYNTDTNRFRNVRYLLNWLRIFWISLRHSNSYVISQIKRISSIITIRLK
jgi:hypothetical protein